MILKEIPENQNWNFFLKRNDCSYKVLGNLFYGIILIIIYIVVFRMPIQECSRQQISLHGSSRRKGIQARMRTRYPVQPG